MKIYAFGGLGTSERLFAKLDFGVHELHFIEFPIPKEAESLSTYIDQLSDKIDTSEPFMLLGFSFGGIFANELAHRLHPEKLILCSTFVDPNELPLKVKFVKWIQLYRWIPDSLYQYDNRISRFVLRLFGRGIQRLMVEIMKQAGPLMSKWSMRTVLPWNGRIPSGKTIRIHGLNERIIPINGLEKVDHALPGGHFLVLTHPKFVNKVLAEL